MKRYGNFIIFERTGFLDVEFVVDLLKWAFLKNTQLEAIGVNYNYSDPTYKHICEDCDKGLYKKIVGISRTDLSNFNSCFVDSEDTCWDVIAIRTNEINRLNNTYGEFFYYRKWDGHWVDETNDFGAKKAVLKPKKEVVAW